MIPIGTFVKSIQRDNLVELDVPFFQQIAR